MRSSLSRLKKLSATALSWQFPRRLILCSRLWCLRNDAQLMLVNCELWSEGTRTSLLSLRRRTTISNACRTKPAGRAVDNSSNNARGQNIYDKGDIDKPLPCHDVGSLIDHPRSLILSHVSTTCRYDQYGNCWQARVLRLARFGHSFFISNLVPSFQVARMITGSIRLLGGASPWSKLPPPEGPQYATSKTAR